MRWAASGEGYTDYNGNVKTCMYVLSGMLKAMQSRIYQSNGFWQIERINDIVSGSFYYRQTPATLFGFSVSAPVLINKVKTISSVFHEACNGRKFLSVNVSIW